MEAEVSQQILEQAPRLGRSDAFEFACHAGLACFNACCRDLTIELSPYDVLRLRRALGLRSGDFLARHTRTVFDPGRGLPLVLLEMQTDEQRNCPFVFPAGCRVYDQRPTACRLYPLGRAVSRPAAGGPGEEFFFLLEEEPCQGYGERRRWTVQQWLEDQGVDRADGPDGLFFGLCQHPALRARLAAGSRLGPRQLSDYHRALYDADRFRDYLVACGEFERLGLSAKSRAALLDDDRALLAFAVAWLRDRLFDEKPLTWEVELDKEAVGPSPRPARDRDRQPGPPSQDRH